MIPLGHHKGVDIGCKIRYKRPRIMTNVLRVWDFQSVTRTVHSIRFSECQLMEIIKHPHLVLHHWDCVLPYNFRSIYLHKTISYICNFSLPLQVCTSVICSLVIYIYIYI